MRVQLGAREPDEKNRRLVEVATQLFVEGGYFPTTLEEISSRARVSKGLISQHFGSKAEMARAILHAIQADLSEHLERGIDDAASTEESVRRIVRLFIEWCVEHPYKARYLYSLSHREFVRGATNELDPMVSTTCKVIVEGQQGGKIRLNSPELLAAAACSPVIALCQLVLEDRVAYNLTEISTTLEQLVCDMIGVTLQTSRKLNPAKSIR